MSAHADDLRHWYAEDLGDSRELALSNTTAALTKLEPGRYIVRVRSVATAVDLWLRFGDEDVVAATAVPSTHFSVGGTILTAADQRALNEVLMRFIVRRSPGYDGRKTAKSRVAIAGILDAGTAVLVVTKVSRDRE